MSSSSIRLSAFGKLNWSLEVTGRRDDGYHEIVSVLQTISIYDVLEVSPAGRYALRLRGSASDGVPDREGNLVTAAVQRFRAHIPDRAPVLEHVDCTLDKRIPLAAGLGGGSSDAAAMLRALDGLSGGTYTAEELEAMAAGIGSDVGFFIRGGMQLATGRGERLTALPDAPPTWFVVVTPALPPVENKTARLYGLLGAAQFSDGSRTRGIAERLALGKTPAAGMLVNTFDAVAERAFPGIEWYREQLRRRCGIAMLCGAGPSLFAPMSSRRAAERAALDLQASGQRARAVRTVTAAESTAVE